MLSRHMEIVVVKEGKNILWDRSEKAKTCYCFIELILRTKSAAMLLWLRKCTCF